jgi:glycosyltransferase involved in cell wall biosynthesis
VGKKVKAIAITSDGPPANEIACNGTATAKVKEAPVLYYPASFNPHKGHAVLLQALRALSDDGADFRLILTGGKTDQIASSAPSNVPEIEEARLAYSQAPEGFRDKLDIRGMVSAETVDECFEMADLVVLPSRYEGFGLPLAEAVARGKRVVCSDIPAFREQIDIYGFDKAVTFVSEATPGAWAQAIRKAMTAPRHRPYTTEELQALFARRTWSAVAKAYTETLAAA